MVIPPHGNPPEHNEYVVPQVPPPGVQYPALDPALVDLILDNQDFEDILHDIEHGQDFDMIDLVSDDEEDVIVLN